MVVLQLIAFTAGVFIADVFSGGLLSHYFALTPALVFQQPWTLITPIFLHGSILHLFFNMFGLLMFGNFLISKIGTKRFLMLYFGAGILGNIGYVITAGLDSTVPVIGASGSVFGILGALAILQPNLMIFVGFIPMPIWVASIFWIFMEFSYGISGAQPGIANFAHLFGLIGGLLTGWKLKKEIIDKGKWLNE